MINGEKAMFVVQVNLTIPNQFAASFQKLLLDNANATLKESGCDCFEVSVSHSDTAASFLLYEKYHHARDFDFHLTTDHFKAFDAETAHMIGEKVVNTFELLPSAE